MSEGTCALRLEGPCCTVATCVPFNNTVDVGSKFEPVIVRSVAGEPSRITAGCNAAMIGLAFGTALQDMRTAKRRNKVPVTQTRFAKQEFGDTNHLEAGFCLLVASLSPNYWDEGYWPKCWKMDS
jgi:hypothetical protein